MIRIQTKVGVAAVKDRAAALRSEGCLNLPKTARRNLPEDGLKKMFDLANGIIPQYK